MRTRSSPTGAVRSTITTASAPSGIGAPVMIRIASPGPTATVGAAPAARVPTTASSTGAPAVSAARTAKPSIAVLANGGICSSHTTGSATTHPSASASGTDTGASGRIAPSTRARASSRATTRRIVATVLTGSMAADTELVWDPPGPGSWQHDPSHAPGAPTLLFRRFNCDAMAEGMATVMKQFGGPMAGMEVKFVHGKYYRRLVPLVGADRDMPAPPAFLVWILSRLHPEFRRRNKRALAAFAGREWQPELERWEKELRPAWMARDLALQEEDIAALDDAALADHVRRVFEAAYEGHVLHFALHGVDLGPIGDLLAHTDRWGIPDLDVVATLEGASPASAAAAVHLDRLGALVRAAVPRPASLDDVRSVSQDASAALDEYLREFGSRIVTGYDVDGRTLAELPEAILASILAAADGPPQDPEAARARADAAADGVRARLSPADRATFDELLTAAPARVRAPRRQRPAHGRVADRPLATRAARGRRATGGPGRARGARARAGARPRRGDRAVARRLVTGGCGRRLTGGDAGRAGPTRGPHAPRTRESTAADLGAATGAAARRPKPSCGPSP